MSTEHTDDTGKTNERGGASYNRGLRASDADREATATILRQHYTEGRLDAREYDERIDRCYAAKTMRELDDLFVDLPRPAASREADQDRTRHDFRPPWRLALIVPVVVALIVLCALTGAHLVWLALPLFFLVFGPFGRWCRPGYRRWREDRPTSA
jgi:hypothetical protein